MTDSPQPVAPEPASGERPSRRKKIVLNTVLIVLGALLGVAVGLWLRDFREPPRERVLLGERVALEGVDWSGNPDNVLVVLQQGCRYCDESAPFYRRLSQARAGHDVGLVAALPPGGGGVASEAYVEQLGLDADRVVPSTPQSIGVPGTPTLLVLDETGRVTESYVGKLTERGEEQVFELLGLE